MRNKLSRFWFRFCGNECQTRYFEIAYLLLLPVAASYIYRFSAFNNDDDSIDPWVYFGYVHNFQDLIDRYGFLYYTVRFGLIFPLITLVKTFGPINGYLAFVYSMYLLAGVPLYLLFRKRFSVHAAILAYAILVSSAWFARTVFWTYSDASAVPYLLAATALMFLEPEYRRMGNVAIGLLLAMAANSNIFALSIGGLAGVAYCVYYKKTLWVRLRRDIPWMAAGFVLVFIGGMVGYYACCRRVNFLDPTLGMVHWNIKGSGHIYQVPLLTLLNFNHLYLLPFLMLSMGALLRKIDFRDRSLFLAVSSYLGASISFYIGYEFFTKTALLELFYYFSFLLVPCILCMTLIPVILARAGDSEFQILNLALASFLLPPLIIAYGSPRSLDNVPVYWVWLVFAFTLFLIPLALRFKKATFYAIFPFALSVQIPLLSSSVQGFSYYALMYGTTDQTSLSRYLLGLKFIETMPKFRDDGRPIYFWYSNADKLANSLQSTYLWGYSRIMDENKANQGLPSLNGVNVDLLRKPSSLVLFDRDRKIVNEGIKKLNHIGVRFAVKETREICEKTICYTIAILNVSANSEKVERSWKESRQLTVALDWGRPPEGAKINREETTISVTTPSKAWSYAAIASMVFSEPLSAQHGIVRILVSVKQANAALGFLGSNESFIKRVDIHPLHTPQELYFEFDNLSELRKFVIQAWDRDESAQVQLLEFSVRKTPSAKR